MRSSMNKNAVVSAYAVTSEATGGYLGVSRGGGRISWSTSSLWSLVECIYAGTGAQDFLFDARFHKPSGLSIHIYIYTLILSMLVCV